MSGAVPLLPLYVVILFVTHNFVAVAKDIDLDVFCDVFVRNRHISPSVYSIYMCYVFPCTV